MYVKRSDETYEMVLAWISSHDLHKRARSTIALVDQKPRYICDTLESKKPLKFAPWNGSFRFFWKNNLIFCKTQQRNEGFQKEQEIILSCFSRSPRSLHEFLLECRNRYLDEVQNKTTIYQHRGDYWSKIMTKKTRPLSTVILNEKVKQPLLDDIREFLDPKTRRWFTNHGIPYRRGYLFYGPPGTGKSSFSESIAGEFGLDIYIIRIPAMNDEILDALFASLPPRCFVLLEDIDAVGTTRSIDFAGLDNKSTTSGKTVSLSGLLNTLDGVASQEGRIVIMTTNHVEKLDEALIRPSRIDKQVNFRAADTGMVIELFTFVFKNEALNEPKSNQAVSQLAKEFADHLGGLELSPAQIVAYLFQYRHSPVAAIQHCAAWVMAHQTEGIGCPAPTPPPSLAPNDLSDDDDLLDRSDEIEN